MGGMSFLNKKPWHPSTFRNEESKWLQEQRAAQVVKTEAEKADLVARETEQRELAALAARARGEQPSRESSAVGFLYAAPPGLKQAQEKFDGERIELVSVVSESRALKADILEKHKELAQSEAERERIGREAAEGKAQSIREEAEAKLAERDKADAAKRAEAEKIRKATQEKKERDAAKEAEAASAAGAPPPEAAASGADAGSAAAAAEGAEGAAAEAPAAPEAAAPQGGEAPATSAAE